MSLAIAGNECARYYIRVNPLTQYPTGGGVMQQYFNATGLACNLPCNMVELVPKPVQPPNTIACNNPSGLRFFYQINEKGNIVPNSFISSINWPAAPGKCRYWVEYIAYCPI